MTFADIVGLTLSALYDPSSWPFLAQTLQDLDVNSGSAAAAAAIHELVHRIVGASPIHGNSLEAFLGVACSDTNNPRNPFVWPVAAANQDGQSPFFGSAWTWLSEPCSTWPARDRDRYSGPFNHATSTPVLVIGNFYDPATPYQGAQMVADMLPGARLLSLDGWGHTSLGQSRCIDSYVSAYLLRQELPPPGTVCPPDTVPFSTSQAPTVATASAAIASLVPAPILRGLRGG
jgi:pimeloyl-ACP methyl ester carboxylesterase